MIAWPSASRPSAAGDLEGLVLPRREVLGRALDAGDRRRDRREQLVVLLGQAGVGADDQVGLERRDLLELEAVGGAEHLGVGALEQVVRPRPGGVRLLAVPLGDADRDDAELEQDVLLGDADADDPLRLLGHDGLAVLVRDGRREGAALGRVGLRGRDVGSAADDGSSSVPQPATSRAGSSRAATPRARVRMRGSPFVR